jgi:hypothetical protein
MGSNPGQRRGYGITSATDNLGKEPNYLEGIPWRMHRWHSGQRRGYDIDSPTDVQGSQLTQCRGYNLVNPAVPHMDNVGVTTLLH